MKTSLEYIFNKTADSDLMNQFNNLINRTGNGTEFDENESEKITRSRIPPFLFMLSGNSGPYNTDISQTSVALIRFQKGGTFEILSGRH